MSQNSEEWGSFGKLVRLIEEGGKTKALFVSMLYVLVYPHYTYGSIPLLACQAGPFQHE